MTAGDDPVGIWSVGKVWEPREQPLPTQCLQPGVCPMAFIESRHVFMATTKVVSGFMTESRMHELVHVCQLELDRATESQRHRDASAKRRRASGPSGRAMRERPKSRAAPPLTLLILVFRRIAQRRAKPGDARRPPWLCVSVALLLPSHCGDWIHPERASRGNH